MSWLPLPDALLREFENIHPAPTGSLQGYAGVLVLGGAVHSGSDDSRGQVQFNEAADRMTQAVSLLVHYPHFQLIYTGIEQLRQNGLEGIETKAPQAVRFFTDMGLTPSRLTFETASANTHENAVFTAAVTDVNIQRPWLLITSAAHMPRALATFQKVGWNVTPYPVDYRTPVKTAWLDISLVQGVAKWQNVVYESLAWLKYWTAGWV